jgi:DNA invertase Pin-like site-specific DNA recombinase
MVKTGEASGIIMAWADRLGRAELDEMLPLVRSVQEAGGRLLSLDGEMGLDGDLELPTVIRMMMANAERKRKRDNFARSTKRAVERGVHLQAVFGYARADDGSKRLVPSEPEAGTVRLAFQMRADGESWTTISRTLNERGVLPRPSRLRRDEELVQRRWSHTTVKQLISKRVYLGEAYNSGHVTRDAHPALVDQRTFDLANQSHGARRAGPEGGYLLTGLVRCSGCGYVMVNARSASTATTGAGGRVTRRASARLPSRSPRPGRTASS